VVLVAGIRQRFGNCWGFIRRFVADMAYVVELASPYRKRVVTGSYAQGNGTRRISCVTKPRGKFDAARRQIVCLRDRSTALATSLRCSSESFASRAATENVVGTMRSVLAPKISSCSHWPVRASEPRRSASTLDRTIAIRPGRAGSRRRQKRAAAPTSSAGHRACRANLSRISSWEASRPLVSARTN